MANQADLTTIEAKLLVLRIISISYVSTLFQNLPSTLECTSLSHDHVITSMIGYIVNHRLDHSIPFERFKIK